MRISKRFDGGSLFAGANSAAGFVSFYETILFDEEIERIYILKGGPGTGKSRFMKDAALLAVERGFSVERYSCSSDPDSLDGVVIGGKIAIIDGTAPHAVDPSSPGARDEIINLGAFWDADKLKEREVEIKVLQGLKGESYARAYRYLLSHKSVQDINLSLALPCFKEKKAMNSVDNIFREIKKGGGYSLSVGMILSVGMKGRVRLDTYLQLGERICLIEDHVDIAYLVTHKLGEKAAERGLNVRISYHPILPDRIDALLLEDSKTVFLVCEADQTERLRAAVPHSRVIRARRLIEPSVMRQKREGIRQTFRLREALIGGAQDELGKVAKAHFELEKIYSAAMDFDAKERYTDALCERLFSR